MGVVENQEPLISELDEQSSGGISKGLDTDGTLLQPMLKQVMGAVLQWSFLALYVNSHAL